MTTMILESRKNMTVDTTILCPVVCVSNKQTRRACVAKVIWTVSRVSLFLLFTGTERTVIKELKFKAKTYFFCISIGALTK